MAYISFDPFRQIKTGTYDTDSDSQLRDKILRTHDAWTRWRNSDMERRVSLLLRLADVLSEERDTHAANMVTEMGKPVKQALAEVDKCALLCRYYATNTAGFSARDIRDSGARRSYVSLDPQGIVFGIMPWNFPYWQVFRFLVPALAGGNGAILKHASNVTACAMAIEAAVLRAGLPESLFTVIYPSHSMIESVISMPEIRGVTLTGSNEAGSRVASLSGRYLKKCVLELGGSDLFMSSPVPTWSRQQTMRLSEDFRTADRVALPQRDS
jgi:succinate-semialdehyde dehydrogenase/glutarate-semialdehyde dehydrogenase